MRFPTCATLAFALVSACTATPPSPATVAPPRPDDRPSGAHGALCPAPEAFALDLSLGGTCTADADCTIAGFRARCVHVQSFHGPGKPKLGPYVRACVADQCLGDGDCPSGKLCWCGLGATRGNVCIESDCETSADCEGRECAEASWPPRMPQPSMAPPLHTPHYCRTAGDGCRTADDCQGGAGCAFSVDHRRYECVGMR